MKRSTSKGFPQNALGIFFTDADKHNASVAQLNEISELWGYTQVHAPLLDYSHKFSNLISHHDKKNIYQVLDRDGSSLILRNDITLFLVDHLARFAKDTEGALRISYADAILRHQEEHDIKKHEYFQIGAELLGIGGPEADAEIILLMIEQLQKLGFKPAIHIGSRAIFSACFAKESLEDKAQIARAIELRSTKTETKMSLELSEFFSIIAAAEDLSKLEKSIKTLLPQKAQDLAFETLTTFELIKKLSPDSILRFDPSELGSQFYHSGLVFKAYLPQFDGPIAQGGRYDDLVAQLGYDGPATGYSLMLSKLLPLIDSAPKRKESKNLQGNFEERFLAAQKIRSEGKVAIL